MDPSQSTSSSYRPSRPRKRTNRAKKMRVTKTEKYTLKKISEGNTPSYYANAFHTDYCANSSSDENGNSINTNSEGSLGSGAEDDLPDLNIEVATEEHAENNLLAGNRVVDLKYVLDWAIKMQFQHSLKCTMGKFIPVGENNRGLGLISKNFFRCNMCGEECSYFTEDPAKTVSVINVGAVWGTLSTGSTFTHLEELLSVIDIPAMNYATFHKIENELAGEWKDSIWASMEAAGKEELSEALKLNQIDASDGTAWTTVYLDGGWSKRSYGHSWNANSGVGVIIGQLTGKVLFLGVRNKYCCICARAANRQEPAGEHICYRNWSKSSTAMEADIMVEAFNQSIQMHELKYLKFIADGDSSVYAKLRQNVLNYGHQIMKIECVNHCIKNYGKALHKIKEDSKVSLQARRLLSMATIKDLQDIAKRAIYNAKGDVSQLQKDLCNGPKHVFRYHKDCDTYYCQNIGSISESILEEVHSTGLIHHINSAIDNLIRKADTISKAETNNKAEAYMSLLAKFTAGKRLNLIQRQAFNAKSHLAGLRYNEGITWSSEAWRKVTSSSPGKNFKKWSLCCKRKENTRAARRLEFGSCKKPSIADPLPPVSDNDYGPMATQPPLSDEMMASECFRIIDRLQVSEESQQLIARQTVGQFGNARYEGERPERLTASNFGAVIRRRHTTSCHSLVKNILYGNVNSDAIQYGKRFEKSAIAMFEKMTGETVEPAGLFVDIEHGYLGASPDGLIGDTRLIEVKCLYKVHKSGLPLQDFLKVDKSTCLEINEEGTPRLKRNHNYYYQILGQLHITRRHMCYLIIYINDLTDLFIEYIYSDEDFWQKCMFPKLELFYKNCLLPELVRGNIKKGLKCIDPPYILEAKAGSSKHSDDTTDNTG